MFRTRLLAVVAGLWTAQAAIAQTTEKSALPTPPSPSPAANAPLSGPSVAPRDVPGVEGRFGESADGLRRRLGDRIPPRVMKQALGAILGEDAREDVRATPEQREKIERVQREFEEQLREYLRTHRDELMEVRGMMPADSPIGEMLRRYGVERPRDGAQARRRARAAEGGGPTEARAPEAMADAPSDKPPARPAEQVPPEKRERVRELLEGMPQPEQALTRVWKELTPEQRKAVEARLNDYRERQAKAREDAYVKQRAGKDSAPARPDASAPEPRGRAEGARGEPGAPPREEMMMAPESDRAGAPADAPRRNRAQAAGADRRQRLLRMFEAMTPEQQDQLLERLEQRMRETSGGRGRPARGEPKPAPDMKDQPVPRPEEVADPE
ncbi:MAG: hypothetical protein IT438_10580 [Phycisphaerales bacterium]|nr:hypothetical protein [Phycisphaerales bacterium]